MQTKTIKKAVWSALLATIPVIALGAEAPWQDPAPQTAAPAGQAAGDSKPAQPIPAVAPEGDPAKLAAPAATPKQGTEDRGFVLGPEDQIDVQVWGNPQIGGAVLVRPDGRISVNLAGEIQAAGRTPSELAAAVADLLKDKDLIKRPRVDVKVLQVNSRKYMINGEVLKPGPFPLLVPTRVMEALVNAGGFRDFANKKNIVIMRGDKRFRFNWNDAVKGKHPEQNIFIEPGDIIIVK